jgi:hypothetical protein
MVTTAFGLHLHFNRLRTSLNLKTYINGFTTGIKSINPELTAIDTNSTRLPKDEYNTTISRGRIESMVTMTIIPSVAIFLHNLFLIQLFGRYPAILDAI